MNSKLFFSLAKKNIVRNHQGYLPYFLSCTGLSMMFFIVSVLEYNLSLGSVYGGRTIGQTLQLAEWVMLIFIVVFLLYTHSFLMKRRQKEFGLFNILGMEKRHIAHILTIEAALIGLASTGAGILLGAITGRLFYLVLLKILSAKSGLSLTIPVESVTLTLSLFAVLHVLTVLRSVAQIHLIKPVNLLKGGQHGETEPKARGLIAALGAAALGIGYYLSLSTPRQTLDHFRSMTHNPLATFFLAVILVIIGTYLLFLAGSVTLLKLMRKNRRLYYHPVRFSVIAGLIHRMRRNAVGLASICILSTMVLVMVSATVSLFAGRDSELDKQYVRKAEMTIAASNLPANLNEKAEAALRALAKEQGGSLSRFVAYRQFKTYLYAEQDNAYTSRTPQSADEKTSSMQQTEFLLIPVEDLVRYQPALTLKNGQALVYAHQLPALPKQISINGTALQAARLENRPRIVDNRVQTFVQRYTVIANEKDIEAIVKGQAPQDGSAKEPIAYTHVFAFDYTGLSTEGIASLMNKGQSRIADFVPSQENGDWITTSTHCMALDKADFNAVYGGMLFVSVILGGLFILALVLIIYYKQISEGYEDHDRFVIMQQVGMSREEVRRAIRTQMLTVFALPLVMSGLHLLASFRLTSEILNLLSLTDTMLFAAVALVTYLLFAVFYTLVYLKTTGSYYRIVRE